MRSVVLGLACPSCRLRKTTSAPSGSTCSRRCGEGRETSASPCARRSGQRAPPPCRARAGQRFDSASARAAGASHSSSWLREYPPRFLLAFPSLSWPGRTRASQDSPASPRVCALSAWPGRATARVLWPPASEDRSQPGIGRSAGSRHVLAVSASPTAARRPAASVPGGRLGASRPGAAPRTSQARAPYRPPRSGRGRGLPR